MDEIENKEINVIRSISKDEDLKEEKSTSAEQCIIDDAMKGIEYRIRIEVPVKRPKRIKQFCLSVGSCFRNCFLLCGIMKPLEASIERPPMRYIYWGPQYDILSNEEYEDKRTTKPPHLQHDENENIGSKFVSNYISTTKYTLLTFLPINLFEQFRKKANLYFLIIACLASTNVSPKDPLFSWLPLIFVLAVSAVKEAFEDYKRYEMDKEINHRPIDVFRPNPNGKDWNFHKISWKDIQVGDMIRITKDEPSFPADILLLQSSTNQGLCNIETANLDGETNLKIKQAIGITYSLPTDEQGDDYLFNNKLQFKLESESPNENISKWQGALTFYNDNDNESISVGMNQMILRGCILKNTDWVIGCVVATGTETKISLNSKKSKFKRSNVDITVDYGLYFIFLVQQILCIFAAIFHGAWLNINADTEWYQYIESDGTPETNYAQQAILNYFTFLVLLDILVPISLYVSMELVKFTQAYLITSDASMVEIVQDESGIIKDQIRIHAQARTSNLNEELGQISYIFSDKTGTLTENKMAFLKCHVDNVRYGPNEMEIQNEKVERIKDPPHMPKFNSRKCLFTDNRLAHKYKTNNKVNEFLTLLSVCHSIIPQYPMGEDGPVVYNASSPDEKALVIFAKNMHYYFYKSHVQILKMNNIKQMIDGHGFYINIYGNKYKFDVYNMLEFTSKRKRMSVIVNDPRDGKIKLYSKGADNVIYQRLISDYKPNGNIDMINDWNKTLESLQVFAADGLRTLVCGYKEIDSKYYCQWLNKLNGAKSAMENRDILVEQCYDEIETDLYLLGATAIEDKLQPGVPETIANLSIAGVSIWVCTGDKVETAINIGRSCRLLTHEMNREDGSLFVCDPDEKISDNECHEIVTQAFKHAWNFLQHHCDNDPNQGFVISGKALSCVFPHRIHDSKGREIPVTQQQRVIEYKYQKELFNILKKCRAVICCRVSPIQKAQIVSLVKQNNVNVITLAIGDGANDVPMIRAAHVGIGISGQEGLQAVMASDYAIGQFRFLQDLLLIHGAWNYRRISILILYSFYKNVMLSMTQIFFGFYSGFSGTLFYDQLSGSTYNLVYTAFPVMLAAVWDRYYTKQIAKLCPELYENGPQKNSFNLKLFSFWFCQGLIHGLIIFLCSLYFIDSTTIGSDGILVGFWVTNTCMFTCVVTVATCKMIIETKTWTLWSGVFFILSYLLWFVFNLVWSSIPVEIGLPNGYMYGVAQIAFDIPQFWFVVLLTLVICLYPDILWKFIKKLWKPTRLDVIEEIEYIKNDFEFSNCSCQCVDITQERHKFIDEMLQYQTTTQRIHQQYSENNEIKTLETTPIINATQHEQKNIAGEDTDDLTKDISINKNAPRTVSTKADLGYIEFQVGRDHSDYIISQQEFMHHAMIKKQWSTRVVHEHKSNSHQNDNEDDDYTPDVPPVGKKPKTYSAISPHDSDNDEMDSQNNENSDSDNTMKRTKSPKNNKYSEIPNSDEEDNIYPL